ncbi:hypothetical protein [Paenarthrobacter sp. PH39-S1]|uniref:hypothetical protein n=1 Tax=Paenarthrobacter sp. PH39-S1 TaxID=3046204 RepID=UPI0024BA09FB|nr:hypothetical protein [Paenarthrobacter sp. PH39-S1]MDJ0358473.1 hypothetical protein [Paenarthrobacter sp. PH39-S1]
MRAGRRARARRVRIGAPGVALTPATGVEAVREVDRVLGITAALDANIGPVKKRNRGLSGGQLLLSMASAQLAGEDFLVGLDRRRADTAGQHLEPGSLQLPGGIAMRQQVRLLLAGRGRRHVR